MINQLTWLVILPAALALANFLPHARETGSFEPQRRWLPAGFFLLWIAATGVHLYCLNYVYNFAFHFGMTVPAMWALAWTAYRRAPEIFAWNGRAPQYATAISALLVPLAAVSGPATKIFFVLTVLNAAIFAAMCLRGRDRQFACHMVFASVVLAVCGMPADWMAYLTPGLHREILIRAGLAVYLILYAAASRNPKAGFFGALLLGVAVLMTFSRHDTAIHWAVRSALVFLLLHSLRWIDAKDPGANIVRNLAAASWVIHAMIWVRIDAALWMPCIPGGIVLAGYLMMRLLRGRWDLFILPAASILTVLSGPGNALILVLRAAPSGLLAVIASFLLFGLGTAAALTKHRWHMTST